MKLNILKYFLNFFKKNIGKKNTVQCGVDGFCTGRNGLQFDKDGKVFVKSNKIICLTNDIEVKYIERYQVWDRVLESEAYEFEIIRCQFCNKPAIRLDNLWPYYEELNACEDHLDEYKKKLGP